MRKIDVIVPVYNQFQVTVNCLNSIFENLNEISYDIIVVDDASTDARIRGHLADLAAEGRIILIRNDINLGYTKSVNIGMKTHRDRDVILLNNDTLVSGNWIDRIYHAAYSHPSIGSVNPLTNASHIGSYPLKFRSYLPDLEVDHRLLDNICANVNHRLAVYVHVTVGFCMYIKRETLNSIGLFDEHYFPYAYFEESDFCYRARNIGWRHVIACDVFVRHIEGVSLGDKKANLIRHGSEVFKKLHSNYEKLDKFFHESDPLRAGPGGVATKRRLGR